MEHFSTQILGQTVHADTLYFSWAIMLFVLLIAAFLASSVKAEPSPYGKRQFVAESIYLFIRELCEKQIGTKLGRHYVLLIGSIFVFILSSYYAGLLPWKMGALFSWWPRMGHHLWHGASPAADLNVPAAIAVIVISVYVYAGISVASWRYAQIFLPINLGPRGLSLNPMCLIELMDLLVRPLTLSLRLFANTVAGETLLATFITLVALFLPVAILGFEMLVGLLQAFLFTILATVYIGTAVQHAEHLVHDSAAEH